MRSSDGGDTWTEPVRVSLSGEQPAGYAQVLASQGRLHAVWLKYRSPDVIEGAETLWHATSDDDGLTWSAPNKVEAPGRDRIYGFDAIADHYGRLHVVFFGTPGVGYSDGRLYETIWNCDHWSEPHALLGRSSVEEAPSLALDERGQLHLVWAESANVIGGGLAEYKDFYAKRLIEEGNCGPVSAEEPDTPRAFDLSQNHPNPTRDMTEISYALAEPGSVRLAVYDVAGRLVVEQDQGHQPPGTGCILLDTTPLTSGVYFYQLTTSKWRETRQMVVAH